MQSNANRLMGETNDNPVDVDAGSDALILQEDDSDEEGGGLASVPAAPRTTRQRGKHRSVPQGADDDFLASEDDDAPSAIDVDSDSDVDVDVDANDNADAAGDEKKKMAMDVSYEGFAIHGRVLCLVVRKRNSPNNQRAAARGTTSGTGTVQPAGQAKMENWITSTQIPVGEDIP